MKEKIIKYMISFVIPFTAAIIILSIAGHFHIIPVLIGFTIGTVLYVVIDKFSKK